MPPPGEFQSADLYSRRVGE